MKIKNTNHQGMTLPELILAISMLIAFTGIAVMVTSYTARFFQPLNVEIQEENLSSNNEFRDILNDHLQINKSFDVIVDFLEEPGISKYFIDSLKCTGLPSLEWKIPSIDATAIPKSYRICIKSTTLTESTYPELAKMNNNKPGIYILYSQPVNGVTVNATPVRRIFCRPKPFCKR